MNKKGINLMKKHDVTLPVVLDKIGEIELTTPPEKVFREIEAAYQKMDSNSMTSALDMVFGVCTMILNCNTANRVFTVEEIADVLPIENVVMLIDGYYEFLNSVCPNGETT